MTMTIYNCQTTPRIS